MRTSLIAALLVGAATMAAAPVAPAAAAEAESEGLRLARKLADATNPYALMVDVNLRSWEKTVRHIMDTEPSIRKLEAEYPGIVEAGIAGARPFAKQWCEQFVRTSLEEKARLFSEGLSNAEMIEAIAFYDSPVGRRLVRSFVANADAQDVGKQLTAHAREKGKAEVTEAMASTVMAKAARDTAGEASAAEQIEMMRFEQKPVAQKIAAIARQADRLLLARLNTPDPKRDAEQAAAINGAMLAFVDGRKKP